MTEVNKVKEKKINQKKIDATKRNKALRIARDKKAKAIAADQPSFKGTARAMARAAQKASGKKKNQLKHTVHKYITPIRAAFDNLKVAVGFNSAIIAGFVHDALMTKAGTMPRMDWQASLNHKSAKVFNAPMYDGVMHYSPRWDKMVNG